MTKKPVIFFATATDSYWRYAEKFTNSFKKFTDAPLKIYREKEITQAIADGYPLYTQFAYFGSILAKEYELVIKVDVDMIICDSINELFEDDYEVGASGNNYPPERGDSFGAKVPPEKYCNTGIAAVRNPKFWDLWLENNLRYWDKMHHVDQDVFNLTWSENNFTARIFDNKEKGVFYGSTGRDCYSRMTIKNNKLICDGRIVKVIHFAGIGGDRMNYYAFGFKNEVCEFFDKLTAK